VVLQVELFLRFALISLIAFGGGQAALPLVERMAVQEAGWLNPATFGAAVTFSYLTPGPILIVATFVGQQAAGLSGALAATLGGFVIPWALAASTAQQVRRFAQDWRLRAFGTGAAAAAIGLLGVTVLDIGREALASWPYIGMGAVALVLALWTRIHPVVLLAAGGVAGWFIA
jgi:chromate transporter